MRRAAAVGVGVFIGCSPLYGLHLPLSYGVALLLGISRLTVYLAANISNPLVAPFLVLAEVQVGSVLRRGTMHPLTVETLRGLSPWTFGLDLVVGAIVVGLVGGAIAALLTYLAVGRGAATGFFEELVTRASERYVSASITGWEFARAKLRQDPVYRAALLGGLLPPGGTLVDLGCGQGLMLALLVEAARDARAGLWPPDQPPAPVYDTLIGVEPRAGVATLARTALEPLAAIAQIDGRAFVYPPCSAVLFFDVLQMIPRADQEAALQVAIHSLVPGGVILVREADASAGRRFLFVRIGNRAKALVTGGWTQTLSYRTADEWMALFASLGVEVERCRSAETGTFGNALFRLRRPSA